MCYMLYRVAFVVPYIHHRQGVIHWCPIQLYFDVMSFTGWYRKGHVNLPDGGLWRQGFKGIYEPVNSVLFWTLSSFPINVICIIHFISQQTATDCGLGKYWGLHSFVGNYVNVMAKHTRRLMPIVCEIIRVCKVCWRPRHVYW